MGFYHFECPQSSQAPVAAHRLMRRAANEIQKEVYRVSAGSFSTWLKEDAVGSSRWFEFLDLINPAHLAFPIERKRKQQNQEDQRTDLL
jgi:hypothetical protein